MRFPRLALCLSLLALAVVPASAQEEDVACSAASLKGPFGYSLKGTVYDNQYYTYLIGAVGRIVADGNGAITGTMSLNFDGSSGRTQFTGTYTVDADCTGSLEISTTLVGANGTTHFDFVIMDDGKTIELVQTDSPFIVTGTLKQQKTPTSVPTPAPATDPIAAKKKN
jgi:hypothetical protein